MSRVRARVLELRSRVSALMPWRAVACRAVPSPLLLMSSRVDITGTYSPLQYTSLCIISPAAGLSLRIAFPRVHVSCLVLFSSLLLSSLLAHMFTFDFTFTANATVLYSSTSRAPAFASPQMPRTSNRIALVLSPSVALWLWLCLWRDETRRDEIVCDRMRSGHSAIVLVWARAIGRRTERVVIVSFSHVLYGILRICSLMPVLRLHSTVQYTVYTVECT